MDNLILVDSDDSRSSIVEVPVPRRPTPPLIEINEDDIYLNVSQGPTKMTRVSSPVPDIQIIESDNDGGQAQTSSGHQVNSISPDHWTSDMIKFYNDDWGDEATFSVERIQAKMDKTPSLWRVSERDYLRRHTGRRLYMPCNNCLQRDHFTNQCPEPPYVPKCHMCGVPGHRGDECPNSICLNCGDRTREYKVNCNRCRTHNLRHCTRCSMRGHDLIDCTDHWRRFHLTTTGKDVVVPNVPENAYKEGQQRWCCNCGRKGHFHYTCNGPKDMRDFAETSPYVASYTCDFIVQTKPPPPRRDKRASKRDKRKMRKDDLMLRLNPMHRSISKDKTHWTSSGRKKKKRKQKNKNRGNRGDHLNIRMGLGS